MSRYKTLALAALLPLAVAACVNQSGSGQKRKSAIDLEAVLPPQSLLREDTVTALTHDRSQSRLAYVGVWAKNSDACAMMDQTAFEGFAVITPDSIRQSSGTCSFAPGEPGQTSLSLDATCKGSGASRRSIQLQMLNSKTIQIRNGADQPAHGMIRCRLLRQ